MRSCYPYRQLKTILSLARVITSLEFGKSQRKSKNTMLPTLVIHFLMPLNILFTSRVLAPIQDMGDDPSVALPFLFSWKTNFFPPPVFLSWNTNPGKRVEELQNFCEIFSELMVRRQKLLVGGMRRILL